MNAHCHADATEQARWFADDIGFKAAGFDNASVSRREARATR